MRHLLHREGHGPGLTVEHHRDRRGVVAQHQTGSIVDDLRIDMLGVAVAGIGQRDLRRADDVRQLGDVRHAQADRVDRARRRGQPEQRRDEPAGQDQRVRSGPAEQRDERDGAPVRAFGDDGRALGDRVLLGAVPLAVLIDPLELRSGVHAFVALDVAVQPAQGPVDDHFTVVVVAEAGAVPAAVPDHLGGGAGLDQGQRVGVRLIEGEQCVDRALDQQRRGGDVADLVLESEIVDQFDVGVFGDAEQHALDGHREDPRVLTGERQRKHRRQQGAPPAVDGAPRKQHVHQAVPGDRRHDGVDAVIDCRSGELDAAAVGGAGHADPGIVRGVERDLGQGGQIADDVGHVAALVVGRIQRHDPLGTPLPTRIPGDDVVAGLTQRADTDRVPRQEAVDIEFQRGRAGQAQTGAVEHRRRGLTSLQSLGGHEVHEDPGAIERRHPEAARLRSALGGPVVDREPDHRIQDVADERDHVGQPDQRGDHQGSQDRDVLQPLQRRCPLLDDHVGRDRILRRIGFDQAGGHQIADAFGGFVGGFTTGADDGHDQRGQRGQRRTVVEGLLIGVDGRHVGADDLGLVAGHLGIGRLGNRAGLGRLLGRGLLGRRRLGLDVRGLSSWRLLHLDGRRFFDRVVAGGFGVVHVGSVVGAGGGTIGGFVVTTRAVRGVIDDGALVDGTFINGAFVNRVLVHGVLVDRILAVFVHAVFVDAACTVEVGILAGIDGVVRRFALVGTASSGLRLA